MSTEHTGVESDVNTQNTASTILVYIGLRGRGWRTKVPEILRPTEQFFHTPLISNEPLTVLKARSNADSWPPYPFQHQRLGKERVSRTRTVENDVRVLL